MEKFFLKRRMIPVENWQVAFLVIVVALSFIGFGALVEHAATDRDRASGVSKFALEIARIPATGRRMAKNILTEHNPTLAHEQRFAGASGFERFRAGDDAALLLARYDGDISRSVVEVVELDAGTVLHRYTPDINEFIDRAVTKSMSDELKRDRHPKRFMISHPDIDESGNLVFHGMYTPLAKIDVCSRIVWTVDGRFHHSIEQDNEGNYWTIAGLDPQLEHLTADGADDALVQVSPDGEILFEKRVGELLIENELSYLVYDGQYPDDPIHLNDIQPALSDSPHWKRSDLFLSLRHPDAIVQYRPSTNEVIWSRQGPWMMQHDVDIVSDHEIAIFNNNTAKLDAGEYVVGTNDTIIYDFESDQTYAPYSSGYKINEIRTATEGRSEVLPDGELFVEEQNHGRLLKMNAAGDITWQYINRATDGRVYLVRWSRYMDKILAHHTVETAAEKCGDDI